MLPNQQLESYFHQHQIPLFRLKQIRQWAYNKGVLQFDQMKNLPQALQQQLAEKFPLLSFKLVHLETSEDQQTTKAIIQLEDGKEVECVLLRHLKERSTVCISSQVGCAVGCTFCATGKLGFSRNLTAEEIADQVLWARSSLIEEGKKQEQLPTNVVYMGMGEPFLNYEGVVGSLRLLQDELGIGGRRVTVSTVGIVPKIKAFADENLQVNLAVSLHAANEALRRQIIPMSRLFDLQKLSEATEYYMEKTHRKVFFAYVMLAGVNDQEEHAHQVVEWLGKKLAHVNLIQFNPIDDCDHLPSSRPTIERFQHIIQSAGFPVTVRYTMGRELDAACGQLRLKRGEKHFQNKNSFKMS